MVPERVIVTAARGGKGRIVSLGNARDRSSSGVIIGVLIKPRHTLKAANGMETM